MDTIYIKCGLFLSDLIFLKCKVLRILVNILTSLLCNLIPIAFNTKLEIKFLNSKFPSPSITLANYLKNWSS